MTRQLMTTSGRGALRSGTVRYVQPGLPSLLDRTLAEVNRLAHAGGRGFVEYPDGKKVPERTDLGGQ